MFANLDYNSTDRKGTNFFSGGDKVNTKNQIWNVGAQLPVKTGGDIQVSWNNRRSDTNNTFTTFNPIYRSNISLSINQPLLAELQDRHAPRRQLKLSRINRQISDIQFRQSVINTVATTKLYYYDLVYAIDNLRAAKDSLELARKLLGENEIRVKVGTMAPLDIVEARSEVAAREVDVIVAENLVGDTEDNLKRVIFPENDPNMWATRIVPTTAPVAEPMPVNLDAAVQNALDNRTDVVAARKALERSDLDVLYRNNQVKPSLDLVAGYGGSGAGGTQIIREPPIGGPIVEHHPRRIRRRPERGLRRGLPHVERRPAVLLLHPQQDQQGAGRAQARLSAASRPRCRSGASSCRWPRRSVPPGAACSRVSRQWPRPSPPGTWPARGSTPSRRSSTPGCPRTSW